MAHELKTTIGDRNVLVQNGAGNSTTVWLEVEQEDGTHCLALTPTEAITLGRSLTGHGIEAHRRLALSRILLMQG